MQAEGAASLRKVVRAVIGLFLDGFKRQEQQQQQQQQQQPPRIQPKALSDDVENRENGDKDQDEEKSEEYLDLLEGYDMGAAGDQDMPDDQGMAGEIKPCQKTDHL